MRKYKTEQKIVFWDIETSPAKVWTWSIFNPRIPHDYIIQPWVILCACWKVHGENKVHTLKLNQYAGYSKDHMDDYQLCKDLRDVLKDVDILVAHNGDKFDLKMFNARLMYHGLEPISHYIQTIDTLKEFRKVGRAPSSSLDFLGRYFGVGRKIHTDKYLWLDAIEDEGTTASRGRALDKMGKYCVQDVNLLQKVYKKMLPYIKTHPNLASPHTENCPKCNSSNIYKNGVRRNKGGVLRQEYRCNNCGSYFRGRYSLTDIGKSQSAL